MQERAYRDLSHPGNSDYYHTGKRCIEPGCSNPAGTWWNTFLCIKHNIKHIDRLETNLENIENSFNAKDELDNLRWKENDHVINHDGNHVWLKVVYDETGKRIGITDCCPYDNPCDVHKTLEQRRTIAGKIWETDFVCEKHPDKPHGHDGCKDTGRPPDRTSDWGQS